MGWQEPCRLDIAMVDIMSNVRQSTIRVPGRSREPGWSTQSTPVLHLQGMHRVPNLCE
ncbi:uncharacterized protein LAESUDRAFT_380054 [Laetiporus sulphureus 93-53]|uniref:Uncharacterized protein n=1 Tax=Laetiporus sulphureus 93-53 TaxID=1314785 RepID=A0A165CKZ7_9APHY|nr:uncharacterized protein LAESUDRAFT_380054 [Laetiporus sulphureus 93-53]KZT02998.1 hypothetical protein LAESUDRAFT_380054 [Laetiporus sulphureus 93-53]